MAHFGEGGYAVSISDIQWSMIEPFDIQRSMIKPSAPLSNPLDVETLKHDKYFFNEEVE